MANSRKDHKGRKLREGESWLRNKGKIYDFAAVARQDAAGILITYAQKEEVNELNGDLTMASLFSDFPFEMNGSVVICDDDKVVSTNRQELTARSIEEAKSQYKNKFEVDENGIVHLRSETGNWFGRREKIKDYDAYIFFPESQVYITRNIICVIYVLLALLLFLLYRVNRSRTEKRSILQDQKRLRVINALGHAYASISLVNLKTEEIEILKSSGNMKPDQKGDMLFKAHQEELIRQVIAEPFQKAYWEFVDISTVAKRLEGQAAQRNIVFHIETESAVLSGVPHVLEEMIYNLCDNAIRYNKDNGSVTLKVEKHPDDITVTVADTGIGIPYGEQERVFERFYRVSRSRSKEIDGTGLGLSIVKHGALLHQATVKMESEVDKGTTIRLIFPNK